MMTLDLFTGDGSCCSAVPVFLVACNAEDDEFVVGPRFANLEPLFSSYGLRLFNRPRASSNGCCCGCCSFCCLLWADRSPKICCSVSCCCCFPCTKLRVGYCSPCIRRPLLLGIAPPKLRWSFWNLPTGRRSCSGSFSSSVDDSDCSSVVNIASRLSSYVCSTPSVDSASNSLDDMVLYVGASRPSIVVFDSNDRVESCLPRARSLASRRIRLVSNAVAISSDWSPPSCSRGSAPILPIAITEGVNVDRTLGWVWTGLLGGIGRSDGGSRDLLDGLERGKVAG